MPPDPADRQDSQGDAATVQVCVDGETIEVAAYTSVAAALARVHGIVGTRVSVTGTPRAAFCGMGICQECRVEVDGVRHVLGCQTVCREGMAIRSQRRRS